MIAVKNLWKTFGAVTALQGVDLEVKKGEMVALIGASGSGKSTLMRHLAGLTASNAACCSVKVNQAEIQTDGCLNRQIRKLRRGIGVIFQQFNLVGRLSVYHNVLLGALGRTALWRSLLFFFKAEDHALAQKALLKVGILDKMRQRASTLSGVQQQRAAIARALVQKADLILADEPIASLDPQSSKKIMEILRNLNQEEAITVVVTLHQVEYALNYCSRVVALKSGRVVYDGPSADLNSEMLREIYEGDLDEAQAPMADQKTEKPRIWRFIDPSIQNASEYPDASAAKAL
ncbi:MAG: phosphonate ABC transporter ATP-binding protein [Candidatus Adiutrix sp.]|jgi:phosphonate transport system ATP-binding protein|nr:phosphonate ABC transporter ATP-binding protein [Candidatus Adiutrix sp.]